MATVYRVVFWTLIFCHHTRSQEEECNNPLGMQSKSIPDESITSSSKLDSDHEAFYGRLAGENAWCSTIEDENPYIEITLDEEKAITEIVTQGSSSDLIWSKKYEIEYLEGGKWTSYNQEQTGNSNCCRRRRNSLHPAIRTRSIRIYPKHPFGLLRDGEPTPACLRLELYGCSAPAGCKDPGRPVNGARKGDSFNHGSQVKFSCMQDYVLVGDSTSVCHRGKWSHDLPKCKATCNDPGIPENGNRNKNGSFIDGDSVEFYCDSNYSLFGPPTIRCLGGKWSSALPQCKASCPDPGIPQNGERVGTNFRHGNDVQFTCKPGFWLVGSRQIVCNEGKWNYKTPKCKAVCSNPGIPVHGKRIGSDFRDGQMVAYRCKPNFNLVGASTVFCVAGQWNATRPTCKATCSDPGTPKHGRRIGSNFGHGHQVTFMCLSKYSLMGSRSMTCHDGKWSSVLPVCKAYCKEPASPQNGARHGNEFEHNKRISFTCLRGFQLTGSANAVCINGKWSHPVPSCKAVCPDPGTPVNGSRIGNSFLDGQTVAFRCQQNYKLVGPLVLRCVAGKWNKDAPKCKAPCPDTSVPSNGQVLDFRPVNRHGARVRFACDSGFKMEGPSSITCNDGKWNSSSPLCKDVDECATGISDCHSTAVCNNTLGSFTCTCKADSVGNGRTCLKLCKDPGAPTNGARRGDKFQHGKRVSFSCNVGYTLVGNRSITCLEGEWTSAPPHCKQNCADPGAPPNGLRRGNDFQHGKRVIFVCQPDFKLSGVNSIRCIDGTWSDTIPVCTALCKDPGIPQHGARKGDHFEDGKTVNFTCNNGYTLVGSSMIQCRSGIWSSALPQCKENCGDPGAPPNGLRRGNDFQHGKRVIFVCQPDFKLSGVNSITCIDGIWNDTIPVCTALCKDPGIPDHGSRKGNNFEDGKTVNFTCNNGYTLVGSSTIECRSGIWSSALPQCKRPCANPGIPQNGLKLGSDFRHGRKVRFVCQLGFKLTGISSITCQDGRWSDQVPVCKAICKIPTRMNNGVILRGNFDNEGTIEFSCNRGYKLMGSRVLRCVNGQWNDRIPECRKAVCPSPPRLVHGSHDGIDFSIGKNVTYSCNAQYLLEGDPVITCVDGQWVGQVPICRVTCPDPANITDGFYSGSDYSEGGTVTYVCDEQYFLDGSSNITCLNGRWNAPPPVCRAPCPAPVPPANGFVFGESHQHHGIIQFFCKGGFTLRGSSFSECVDGKWNTPKPSCEGPSPSSCRKPPVPMNARMLDSQAQKVWFNDGDRIYYKCNLGFSPSGFSIRRCRNRGWSRLSFRCNAKSCGHPGDPVNGRLNSYMFTYNSSVEYSCNQGFTLVGSQKRVCQANQTWTGTLPQCTKVNCGTLPTPSNAEKVSETSTFLNGQVTFRCIGREFKLEGSATRTCLASRLWSGQQPSCKLIDCGDPGKPMHSVRNVRVGFIYGGSVEFTCNANYKRDGASRIFCKIDGNWSRALPRCLAPCSNPGAPRHGRRTGNDFRHGETVRFSCNRNYRLVGSRELTCNNGEWRGVKPRCRPRKARTN